MTGLPYCLARRVRSRSQVREHYWRTRDQISSTTHPQPSGHSGAGMRQADGCQLVFERHQAELQGFR